MLNGTKENKTKGLLGIGSPVYDIIFHTDSDSLEK